MTEPLFPNTLPIDHLKPNIMQAMNLDFNNWFDIFSEFCTNQLHYYGPIDRGTFEFNWESGEWPEDAARVFVKEMNED